MPDTTDRKSTEQALQQSEEWFRTVADWAYDWEYWIDPQENILYMSPSCERISCYQPDEFVADPKLLERIILPHDQADYQTHKVQHLEVLENNESSEITFGILPKDGRHRWIEHICRPVYSVNGQYLGRRVSNRDVTDRKSVEDALRRNETRLQDAERLAQLGHWELDIQSDKLRWSNETHRIFELSPSEFEVTYDEFLEIVHPDDRELVSSTHTESLKTRKPYNLDHCILFIG